MKKILSTLLFIFAGGIVAEQAYWGVRIFTHSVSPDIAGPNYPLATALSLAAAIVLIAGGICLLRLNSKTKKTP